MRNIWTKVGVTAASCLAGLCFASVSLAAEASNSHTGAGSTNSSLVTIENNITLNSTNNATINNNISVSANTGSNSASQNTGDGTVSSGDITGAVTVENVGNENGVFNSLLKFDRNGACNFSASNSQTGAGSSNNSSVDVNNNIGITLRNDAEVFNGIGADLNTGGNSADKNTGSGSVSSGDIDFSVSVRNELNENAIGAPTPEAPEVPEVPGPGVIPQPVVVPAPGKVLAEVAGLPVTGNNLPTWAALLAALGLGLKLLEKAFKVCFGEEAS